MNNVTQSEGTVAKDMGLLARIINVFVSPASTFRAVREKPKWAVPLVITLLIMLGVMIVLTPIVMEEGRDAMEEKMAEQGLSDEQIDNAVQTAQKVQKFAVGPSTVVMTLVVTFIVAAVWLFLSNTILGGNANYKQMLGVVVYSGFIGLLGFLIKLPIMWSQRTMNVHFSLATFMSDASKDSFLYKLLANVELFNIWTIAVVSIGIAVVADLKSKSVWPWVLIVTILYWVAAAGLGSVLGQ